MMNNDDDNAHNFFNAEDTTNLPKATIDPSTMKGVDDLFDKMSEEDTKIRNMIIDRRAEAARKDKELQLLISALKNNGYDDSQINEIFNSGLLSPELINELIAPSALV